MKKIIIIITILIIIGLGIFWVINKNKTPDKYYVEIVVKDYGKIEVELDNKTAPITVKNFIDLVNKKFYDGTTFHRIIDDFMIQGGGYLKSGVKKEANTIKGEFKSNGVENNISHKRGVISMARSNSKNSASSQFFITQADSLDLDGNYAAFGYVIRGMDVVDKIAKEAKPIDNNGSIKVEERPIIESIRIK